MSETLLIIIGSSIAGLIGLCSLIAKKFHHFKSKCCGCICKMDDDEDNIKNDNKTKYSHNVVK